MTARIRDYADSDHAAVASLVETVLAEYGFTAKVGGLERDLAEIRERYSGTRADSHGCTHSLTTRAGERAGFWVADDDGVIVGSIAVRPVDDATCEIKRLYLRADRRGSGLGHALYAHAEAFARAAGYARIWLESSRRFVKAHRLYERNGFVLVEQIDNDWEDNIYEKRIDGA